MTRMRNWIVISTGLMLAACSGKTATAPSSGPTGSFKGTLVGANVSAVLTVIFPGSAASLPSRKAHFSIVPAANAAAAPISVTGTLAIVGDGAFSLSGTYDGSANPQLTVTTVTGGGYTITGNYTATNGVFSGSFSGPGGTSGQWTVSTGGIGGDNGRARDAGRGESARGYRAAARGRDPGVHDLSAHGARRGGVYTADGTSARARGWRWSHPLLQIAGYRRLA